MQIRADTTDLATILPFRQLFLRENNFQIRYNACHERGWADSYLFYADDKPVGYGAVRGQEISERNTIFEFYLLPAYRKYSSFYFKTLLEKSKATLIECQSNDLQLSYLLFEFANGIRSDVILFEDQYTTHFLFYDIIFRRTQEQDYNKGYKVKDMGAYVLERAGEIVATGGFLLHYNPPFADLYMDVKDTHRRQGLGSFILQELKKECYNSGKVPTARCNIQNQASKATLLKAGFKIVGYMLLGKVKNK